MIENRRKLLVIVGVAFFVLALIVGVVATLSRSRDDENAQTDAQILARENPVYYTVNVTNASDYSIIFPADTSYALWTSMWRTVNKNVDEDQDYYFGNIRGGSLQQSTTSIGAPRVEVLVDLPDIQRTFKITIEGNEESGYQTVYITCPSPAELVYPPTPCVGQESDS